MRAPYCLLILCLAVLAGCGNPRQEDAPDPQPSPSGPPAVAPGPDRDLQRPPIDLGDVDSGISITARLAPEAGSTGVREELLETRRNDLAMCTIHVSAPLPAALPIRFEVASARPFAEKPVVLRVRVFRDDTPVSEEYAFLLGAEAHLLPTDASGLPVPRAFVVDALSGLPSPPESVLMHARGTAWLMEEGTAEALIDPRTASSDHHVSIMSNPVRIHFGAGGETGS